MNIDQYGRVELSDNEAFEALYQGKIDSLNSVFLENKDTINQFNQAIISNADQINKIKSLPNLTISIEDFDKENQKHWFIPEDYINFPIEEWLYNQCKTELETNRVSLEINLFRQYNMFNVLLFLKYLVDTMRENKIVWGVGRGSSVSSYLLYLIGIHKINPLKYNLDIHEFLK